jgi:hypothetical protein
LTDPDYTPRPPNEVAADIRKHLPTGGATWIHVRCYVQAMEALQGWRDVLPGRADSRLAGVTFPSQVANMAGWEVALGFIMNAGAWRGVEARRVKEELRRATIWGRV